MMTNVIIWFVFGILAGLFASIKLYKENQRQLLVLLLLGTIGAIIGGALGQIVASEYAGLDMLTIFISILGAVVLIGCYKNISPQR